MSRSDSSEKRSRRRPGPRPSASLFPSADTRRKRRLAPVRKRSPQPPNPLSSAPGQDGINGYRGPQRYQDTPAAAPYPPAPQPFYGPPPNTASYYLPPASSSPAYTPTPNYPNQSYPNQSYPNQSYPNSSGSVPPSARSPQGQLPRPSQSSSANGAAARGSAKDMRFGPASRRRHQLSSNPAFGQPRSRQRHSSNPAHNGMLSRRPMDRSAPAYYGSNGVSLPEQSVRTQSLHPRPVSPSRSRQLAQASNRAIAPHHSRSLVKQRRRPPEKPVSPMVYGIRLLILGTGVGVIAGTIISTFNPANLNRTAGFADSATIGSGRENVNGQAMGSMAIPGSQLASANMDAIPKQQAYTDLARQLDQMAQGYPDIFPGVFVLDLDTFNYVDLNGASSFAAASTIKVPILIAFFQDVEHNKISLDEMLTMTEADLASGSGDMQFGGVGDQYSAIETATKMIMISDNTATNMLIRRMGGMAELNRRFRSWGLTLTQIRNPLPDLEGTNTTSPSELTHLMALVSQGQLLSLRSRDRMLDIMYRTKTDTLLPAGIGPNAAIAHKTGDIGSMVGDTGIVDTADGKRYAITVMMRRPHNDNRAQDLIRQMAESIHAAIQVPPVVTTGPELTDTDSDALTPRDAEASETRPSGAVPSD